MDIPPTTSRESRLREALLDALHAQWRELGVPFGSGPWSQPLEVIDPEALIWCSLEFARRDLRLIEGVHSWVADHRSSIMTQRLNTTARHHAADPRELHRCRSLSTCLTVTAATTRRNVGVAAASAGAIHLRARDILGNGLAAFLLVELLGHPRGVRCRQVAETTGASYRSIVEVAGRWQRSSLVTLDRGFCTLLDPRPWHEVLRCTPGSIVTVPWSQIYTLLIDHLRELIHAGTVGIADDDRLITAAARQVRARVAALIPGLDPSSTPIVTSLLESISD
jgi:hypothetical protein